MDKQLKASVASDPYSYFTSSRALLACNRYQITLLDDWDACTWTTCARSFTQQQNGQELNPRPLSQSPMPKPLHTRPHKQLY